MCFFLCFVFFNTSLLADPGKKCTSLSPHSDILIAEKATIRGYQVWHKISNIGVLI